MRLIEREAQLREPPEALRERANAAGARVLAARASELGHEYPETVEIHLGHAHRKLDTSSRARPAEALRSPGAEALS